MPDNQLFYGDDLDVLRIYVPDVSVDLTYLDPPFQSGRNYIILFRNEAGVGSEEQVQAFKDTWHWGTEAEHTFQDVIDDGGDLAQALIALRSLLDYPAPGQTNEAYGTGRW